MIDLQPHPANHGFSWAPPPGPYRVISDDQARAYDEVGAFVFEGALAPSTLEAVLAEIDPVEARIEAELRKLEGGKLFIARADAITFTTHLVTRSSLLRELVASPPFTDLCADLIGPDVRLYWDQAVYKKHDADATFPWHQDNGYAFVEPQQYLTCWIALTDATEDNGCPQVVPGVHRTGTLAHRLTDAGYVCLDDPPGAVAVPAKAGDVVVFSSLTPHCTGPNLTDGVRKAYIVQYAPDGAAVLARAEDGSTTRTPATDPQRQFPVLAGGERVAPPDGQVLG
jgi:ectoine hydroxylase-related dioxygenase (phytanoyl-CoA dioxygenase family)